MLQTYLPLALVTISEATIGIFVKLTGDAVPVFTLNFYRIFFAAVLIALVMPLFNSEFWKFPKHNLRDVLIIGALIAAQVSFFTLAMTLAPVANVVIFWSVAPFFAFIFSWFFLGEKAKKEHIFIFLIAFVGLLIAEPFGGGNTLGHTIAFLDGAIYAGMITYMRHEGTTESSNDIFWFVSMASLYLLPGFFFFGPGEIFETSVHTLYGINVPVIIWVLGLGMISTGVAYFFISRVLKYVNANVYSLVDIIVSPIVAAFLAYLVFSEVPSENIIYGGALLLVSGFWLTRNMSAAKKKHYREATAKVK
jgi:drug/metabolite transporter (DMT)-like permease